MGGRPCAVYGCENKTNDKEIRPQVSFHCFPFSWGEKYVKEWTALMRRENFRPLPSTIVCSEHFEESCFTYQNFTGRRHLKRGSEPTIFCFNKKKKRQRTSYKFGNTSNNSSTSAQQMVEDSNTEKRPDIVTLRIVERPRTSSFEYNTSPSYAQERLGLSEGKGGNFHKDLKEDISIKIEIDSKTDYMAYGLNTNQVKQGGLQCNSNFFVPEKAETLSISALRAQVARANSLISYTQLRERSETEFTDGFQSAISYTQQTKGSETEFTDRFESAISYTQQTEGSETEFTDGFGYEIHTNKIEGSDTESSDSFEAASQSSQFNIRSHESEEEKDEPEDEPQYLEEKGEPEDEPQYLEEKDEPEDEPQYLEEIDEPEDEPQYLEEKDEPEDEPQYLEVKGEPEDEPQYLEEKDEPEDEPQYLEEKDEPEDEPQYLEEKDEPEDEPQYLEEIDEPEDEPHVWDRLSHPDNPHFLRSLPPSGKNAQPTQRCVACCVPGKKKGQYIKQKATRYMCPACNVALCIEPCHRIYHTRLNYKRILHTLDD